MNIQNRLKDKYVAFLDVLGFSDLIFKDRYDALNTYFDTIHSTIRTISNDKKRIESLIISDSIILVAPNTKEQFKLLVRAVQTIQARLMQENIWLRGGISHGKVDFDLDRSQIVGKGFIKAYLLENVAKYPRVIIDSKIIQNLKMDRSRFIHFMNQNEFGGSIRPNMRLVVDNVVGAEDDYFFVSYADRVMEDAIELEDLGRIYTNIYVNLYGDVRHFQKFAWVKKYFHQTLEHYYQSARFTYAGNPDFIRGLDKAMVRWNQM